MAVGALPQLSVVPVPVSTGFSLALVIEGPLSSPSLVMSGTMDSLVNLGLRPDSKYCTNSPEGSAGHSLEVKDQRKGVGLGSPSFALLGEAFRLTLLPWTPLTKGRESKPPGKESKDYEPLLQ